VVARSPDARDRLRPRLVVVVVVCLVIDGEHLAKLIIRYNVGCRIEEVFHTKKVDEDFFE
jgi:restriction endonuclease Mrr